VFSLQFEGKEFARDIASGVSGGKFEHTGKIGGRFGEAVRIPFNLLTAADNFWKTIARNQELWRQAYVDASKKGLTGDALEAAMKESVESFVSGSHPNQEALRIAMENAALNGTFQKKMGSLGTAASNLTNAHPFLSFFAPFIKTPVNIAKETAIRTPAGLAYTLLQKNRGKITDEKFIKDLASGVFGTTLGALLYFMNKEGDLITGGGPTDPEENQNLQDTGWRPYSVKIGDRYVSYQRLEPLSSLMGFIADSKELEDTGTITEAVEKIGGSVMENMLNKTFLAGLTGLTTFLHDPKRYGKQFARQLEGSMVPALVGKGTQALDPVVRVTDPFELIHGIPEPIAARLPGLSEELPARRTPIGEDRERVGSALERFANPFTVSQEKQGPLADVQREFARLGRSPDQPKREHRVGGGKKLTLDDREYKILQDTYQGAADRVSKLIRTSYYKNLPDDEDEARPGQETKWDAILKIYRAARDRGRMRLYQDPKFRVRARKEAR
jgi:hypothetical protein